MSFEDWFSGKYGPHRNGFGLCEADLKGAWDACVKTREWIPVSDRLPESGRKVLIFYRNSYDHDRRVCGFYAGKFAMEVPPHDDCDCADYNEADDTTYLSEGWYESIDNWPDYSSVFISEGKPTHWMPLPETPETQGA